MSNWLGSGAPLVIVADTNHQFPRPQNGGRDEYWDPTVNEAWENQDGDRLYGDRKFRFIATYVWHNLTDDQVKNLLTWYNQRQQLTLRPYSEVPQHQILCRIEDAPPKKGGTVFRQDVLSVRFESVSLFEAIAIPDTALLGSRKPPKGIVT